MKFVPIPIHLLEVGKPMPVDIWSPGGQLLLKRGQPIISEQHRLKLYAHEASAEETAGHAWQRAYERMVHKMLREGVDLATIARMPMPSEILQRDFVQESELKGGWLDLQEVLRGILYQGGLAINPIARLNAIQKTAIELIETDADESLFSLIQMLADNNLGYCATHALLCATICAITAPKLGVDKMRMNSLFASALTMNIGMAREQDSMSRQATALHDWQRNLVKEHAHKSVEILVNLGVDDEDQLDMVRWHHDAESHEAQQRNLICRRLLRMVDVFVAMMAARRTRSPIAPVRAVKQMVVGAQGDAVGMSSAMAQAVGFYPPGSYVTLASGEIAVSVQRGPRANTPWVIPVLGKDGLPSQRFMCLDTTMPVHAIVSARNFDNVKVAVNLEKVRKARERIPRNAV